MRISSNQLEALDPLLVPRPKSVDLEQGHSRVALTRPARRDLTASMGPSAYSLSIGADGAATICAGNERSASHAHHTLAQLMTQYGTRLPVLRIEDEPAFERRGQMLDVSRCRIPTMEEFELVLDQFSKLKLNHVQLYFEHAFAYQHAEAIWRGCSPLTGDEIRTLSSRANLLGIELAANQNCFGHLTRWLSDPAFSDLAETHGDWDFAGMPRSGPFSLCPTDERSVAFVESLLDQLLPHFSHSSLVNLGCDETYDVGQGRSRSAVTTRGKGDVWGRFVAEVCSRALERGYRPMVWGDIAAEHPEAIDLLPREVIGLVWGYEPSSDFLTMGRAWSSRHRSWWVCPGLSDWRSFTGRTHERRANIRNAASQGFGGGAAGFLATSWGDLGHRQTWPITLMGVAEAADAAWSGKERHDSFLDAVSLHVFGDRTLEIARWIDELGEADAEIRADSGKIDPSGNAAPLLNAGALFTELHPPPMELSLPADPEPWLGVLDRLTDLRSRVPNGAGELIEDECRHAVDQAIFAARVAVARRTRNLYGTDFTSELVALKGEYTRLWKLRSRPGGLDESLAHWDTIGQREDEH